LLPKKKQMPTTTQVGSEAKIQESGGKKKGDRRSESASHERKKERNKT